MALVQENLGTIQAFSGSSIRDRIVVMFNQVAKGLRDPLARAVAAEAIRQCPDRDDWCEIQAIYWLFRNHGRYSGDVRNIDTYQTFRRTWELGIYDCDDATIGLMTLLLSVGFQAGAKTIAHNSSQFNHVYAVVEYPRDGATGNNRKIIPLDATVPRAVPGWEPPKSERKQERVFWYAEQGMEG